MLTCKPTCKQSRDQTQQVTENGDCFSNDPRNHPKHQSDEEPRSDRQETAFVHVVGISEYAHIDIFTRNVPIDDTGNDNLAPPPQRLVHTYVKKFSCDITHGWKRNAICDLAHNMPC